MARRARQRRSQIANETALPTGRANASKFYKPYSEAMQCGLGGKPQDRTASRGALSVGEFNSPTE
ncbi:hypothetical protein, partial [Moorena sp. SIO3A2]